MAKDKENILYNPYETRSSDSAIQAYLDARKVSRGIHEDVMSRGNWDVVSDISSDILGAADVFRAEKQKEEERRRLELEGYENEFSDNVSKITENAGSLGEEAYGLATEQAKLMQEEYMQAVQDGDKEMQGKLKMKLTGLSTSVQSLKESLSIAAELKNDEELSHGRTALEKEISAVCTNPNNLVYDENEWKFKNPNYDENVEGSKQFFTQDDLNNSLGMIDEDASLKYIEFANKQNEHGVSFIDGDPKAKDFNFNRIKASIGDQFITQDNIMSVMHDDFKKSGMSSTFAADLGGYLDSMPDLYAGLGIDVNGDGEVNSEDWDSEEDKKIIRDAITNKNSKHYNYNVSKDIVAGYLTMHAEKKFYGEHKLSLIERKKLVPKPKETPMSFIKRGGIMGAVEQKGIIWDEENEKWENNSSSSNKGR